MKRLIVCADDFGRDIAVNEAVEEAHRNGILTCASLMVGAPAAADAVERAHRLPNLRIGLHVVLIDGTPLTADRTLVRSFDRSQIRTGFRYFLLPGIRRALAAEIRAQFAAFRATGLALDHVNSHKHMQLHPTVARLIVEIGSEFGMRAMRVPDEPMAPLRQAFPQERRRVPPYRLAATALRRRLRRAGIVTNDHLFGIAWSGGMDEKRVLALLAHLPNGVSELYSHPAVARTSDLERAMPGYRNPDELAALVSPVVRQRVEGLGIALVGYGDLMPAV